MDVNSVATGFLAELGYTVNESALRTIQTCEDWYRNAENSMHLRQRVDGAEYQLTQMGFAKRGCADDANLCEIVEVNGGGGKDDQFEAVKALMEGDLLVSPGDYIIKGVQGELYPCKPDIFEQTYEAVEGE